MTPPVTCSLCGQIRASSGAALSGLGRASADADAAATTAGWLREVGRGGRVSWVCPTCVRRHLRSIEARLDEDWW